MSKYGIIKKEFNFLTAYGFKICFKQKHGSYYFAVWTNEKIEIMVLYDETVEDPVTIRVYDANSLGTVYDAVVYKKEFILDSGSPREKICCASKWLKNAIEEKIIAI